MILMKIQGLLIHQSDLKYNDELRLYKYISFTYSIDTCSLVSGGSTPVRANSVLQKLVPTSSSTSLYFPITDENRVLPPQGAYYTPRDILL
jgi:hypothetical protein